jgi:predicted DNA-binding transcriptional regulator YafY
LGRVPAYSRFITLAVERIRELRLTDNPFVIDATFDPEPYSNEAFGVIWEKPMTVVLRFRSDQAPYVAEREWHPSQTLKTLRDGRVEMTFHAGGTYEIVRWILGWGDAVEVLRPSRLRNEVAQILQNAAGCYLATRKLDTETLS